LNDGATEWFLIFDRTIEHFPQQPRLDCSCKLIVGLPQLIEGEPAVGIRNRGTTFHLAAALDVLQDLMKM
jgi:hypothetical protein